MFSTAHLDQLESASRVLLSPLATPDVDAWRAEAAGAVRRLFGADYAVFGLSADAAPFVCNGLDFSLWGRYIEHLVVSQSAFEARDPVMDRWLQLQRTSGRGAFTEAQMNEALHPYGLSMRDSELVSGVAPSLGLHGIRGMTADYGAAEAGLQVMYSSEPPSRAEDLALLRVLLPSFRAGLDALLRFGAHRLTLDAVSEPLAAFDADGRLLHQNAALSRLLSIEPERDRVDVELRVLARRLRALAFPLRHDAPGSAGPPAVSREVQTARGRYTLRGVLLQPGGGPGGSGFGEAALVSVALDAPPTLPDPEAVRARHGLTKREAEVMLLLVEGLSNAEVAERLFVSPHTARHHVENVLGKLGLSSRAAVAARLLGRA